ncbi:gluconokinase [Vogesella sp. DC21W]|uniref:Gluconokinase n=1 Tax=Vogesella aquatica TaxID=2984206 RepID=A0ABT5IVI2_9NEIS|nr:gluconokinase [Vogesella aquatica]MDC7716577.1 gluconokinase [Vogesella aquatica]
MIRQTMLVVMGVCGSGKSEVGRRLAAELGARFVEGDDFHPPANVARMEAGIPLTDDDRGQWLQALRSQLQQAQVAGEGVVLSCSALKRRYRDLLRDGCPGLAFVYLKGERALIEARMRARQGHFMPLALIDSQLADLEPPQAEEGAIEVDIRLPVAELVAGVVARLTAQTRSSHA